MKTDGIGLGKSFIAALTLTASVLISASGALGVESSPSVVRAVPPIYPPIARAAELSGEVIVEATIDVQGEVTSVNPVEGPRILCVAAEKAASRWRFNAIEGKERKVRLTFQFTLISSNKGTPDDLGVIFWPPYKVEVRDTRYRVK